MSYILDTMGNLLHQTAFHQTRLSQFSGKEYRCRTVCTADNGYCRSSLVIESH